MASHTFKNRSTVSTIGGRGYTVFPSKLNPSLSTDRCIVRHRLLVALDAGLNGDLTLVRAPAGFGKSVLLAQWYEALRKRNVRAAWLKLDNEDQEPMRCLTHINWALMPDDDTARPEAEYCYHESREALLRSLYNAINKVEGPFVLILDDYEQAESAEFNRTISRFVELMPDNFHLAIASRVTPVELKAKLWTNGGINPVSAQEICFTEAEIDALLADNNNRSLTDYILTKTDGWPVATRLFIDTFADTGTAPQLQDPLPQQVLLPVREFIWDQLLGDLSGSVHQSLIKMSFLEEIIPELADRICLHDESSALLDMLIELEPLITKDVEKDSYRINHLLRACLRLSLNSLTTPELRRIHSVVVDWYIEHRDIAVALSYAGAANSAELFARIVEFFGAQAITIQDGVTALKFAMENIHTGDIRKSVRLTLAEAVVLIKDGHFSMASRKLEQADKMLDWDREYEDKYYGSVQADYIATQYLMALYKNENFNREYLDRCEIETYQNSAFDGLLGFVHALKSLLYQRNASFPRAETEAERSLAYYKSTSSNYGIASVHLVKGLNCFAKGQLDLAMRSYENALDIITVDFSDDPGLNAIAESLAAEVKYERNELDNLSGQLEGAIDALESYDGWLDTFIAAYRVATALALNQNDIEAAHIILDRATLLANERSLDEIERLAELLRINVYIRAGELKRAEQLYNKYVDENSALHSILDKQVIWRELDDYYFTTARLQIAGGDGQQALLMLEPIVQVAHKTGRLLSMTRGHILQSLAYQSLDKQDEAISILRHAATVGCSEKYLRVFLDEGEGVIPVLQHVIDSEKRGRTRTKLGKYCSRVLSVYRRELEGDRTSSALTPRERQILIGLSHGSPNKIIARDLGVTESTIKFHLKKIYSKLGVSKRSTAVIEARRQQLF